MWQILQLFYNIAVAVDSAQKSATLIMSMYCGWTAPWHSCQISSLYDVCLLLHTLFFIIINLNMSCGLP